MRSALSRALVSCAAAVGWLVVAGPAGAGPVVYFNDFDGGESLLTGVSGGLSGVTATESVQGYAGLGTGANQFAGRFLRNDTGWPVTGGPFGFPGRPTVLTLTNLPAHTSIQVGLLLAIIDSWDGNSSTVGGVNAVGDFFNVRVDGQLVFRQAFDTFDPADGYAPPTGGLIANSPLGFSFPSLNDSAYDMSLEPSLAQVPHTSSSLTVEWFADGRGWQGTTDESWAIENIQVRLNGGGEPAAVPEPATLSLAAAALSLLGCWCRVRRGRSAPCRRREAGPTQPAR